MKYNHAVEKIILACAVLMVLMVSVTSSRAAVDYFLKIKGVGGAASGYEKIIQCASGQHIKVAGLKSGTYSVQLVDRSGNKLAGKLTGLIEIKSVGRVTILKPESSSLMAIKGQGGTDKALMRQQPLKRKRSLKPIFVRKTVDSASPIFFSIARSSGRDENPTESVSFSFQKIR